jgi:hypothetical protein
MTSTIPTEGAPTPVYYVRHPDGTFSVAEPQPTPEQIEAQREHNAQCDRSHGGGVCPDPHCFRGRSK